MILMTDSGGTLLMMIAMTVTLTETATTTTSSSGQNHPHYLLNFDYPDQLAVETSLNHSVISKPNRDIAAPSQFNDTLLNFQTSQGNTSRQDFLNPETGATVINSTELQQNTPTEVLPDSQFNLTEIPESSVPQHRISIQEAPASQHRKITKDFPGYQYNVPSHNLTTSNQLSDIKILPETHYNVKIQEILTQHSFITNDFPTPHFNISAHNFPASPYNLTTHNAPSSHLNVTNNDISGSHSNNTIQNILKSLPDITVPLQHFSPDNSNLTSHDISEAFPNTTEHNFPAASFNFTSHALPAFQLNATTHDFTLSQQHSSARDLIDPHTNVTSNYHLQTSQLLTDIQEQESEVMALKHHDINVDEQMQVLTRPNSGSHIVQETSFPLSHSSLSKTTHIPSLYTQTPHKDSKTLTTGSGVRSQLRQKPAQSREISPDLHTPVSNRAQQDINLDVGFSLSPPPPPPPLPTSWDTFDFQTHDAIVTTTHPPNPRYHRHTQYQQPPNLRYSHTPDPTPAYGKDYQFLSYRLPLLLSETVYAPPKRPEPIMYDDEYEIQHYSILDRYKNNHDIETQPKSPVAIEELSQHRSYVSQHINGDISSKTLPYNESKDPKLPYYIPPPEKTPTYSHNGSTEQSSTLPQNKKNWKHKRNEKNESENQGSNIHDNTAQNSTAEAHHNVDSFLSKGQQQGVSRDHYFQQRPSIYTDQSPAKTDSSTDHQTPIFSPHIRLNIKPLSLPVQDSTSILTETRNTHDLEEDAAIPISLLNDEIVLNTETSDQEDHLAESLSDEIFQFEESERDLTHLHKNKVFNPQPTPLILRNINTKLYNGLRLPYYSVFDENTSLGPKNKDEGIFEVLGNNFESLRVDKISNKRETRNKFQNPADSFPIKNQAKSRKVFEDSFNQGTPIQPLVPPTPVTQSQELPKLSSKLTGIKQFQLTPGFSSLSEQVLSNTDLPDNTDSAFLEYLDALYQAQAQGFFPQDYDYDYNYDYDYIPERPFQQQQLGQSPPSLSSEQAGDPLISPDGNHPPATGSSSVSLLPMSEVPLTSIPPIHQKQIGSSFGQPSTVTPTNLNQNNDASFSTAQNLLDVTSPTPLARVSSTQSLPFLTTTPRSISFPEETDLIIKPSPFSPSLNVEPQSSGQPFSTTFAPILSDTEQVGLRPATQTNIALGSQSQNFTDSSTLRISEVQDTTVAPRTHISDTPGTQIQDIHEMQIPEITGAQIPAVSEKQIPETTGTQTPQSKQTQTNDLLEQHINIFDTHNSEVLGMNTPMVSKTQTSDFYSTQTILQVPETQTASQNFKVHETTQILEAQELPKAIGTKEIPQVTGIEAPPQDLATHESAQSQGKKTVTQGSRTPGSFQDLESQEFQQIPDIQKIPEVSETKEISTSQSTIPTPAVSGVQIPKVLELKELVKNHQAKESLELSVVQTPPAVTIQSTQVSPANPLQLEGSEEILQEIPFKISPMADSTTEVSNRNNIRSQSAKHTTGESNNNQASNHKISKSSKQGNDLITPKPAKNVESQTEIVFANNELHSSTTKSTFSELQSDIHATSLPFLPPDNINIKDKVQTRTPLDSLLELKPPTHSISTSTTTEATAFTINSRTPDNGLQNFKEIFSFHNSSPARSEPETSEVSSTNKNALSNEEKPRTIQLDNIEVYQANSLYKSVLNSTHIFKDLAQAIQNNTEPAYYVLTKKVRSNFSQPSNTTSSDEVSNSNSIAQKALNALKSSNTTDVSNVFTKFISEQTKKTKTTAPIAGSHSPFDLTSGKIKMPRLITSLQAMMNKSEQLLKISSENATQDQVNDREVQVLSGYEYTNPEVLENEAEIFSSPDESSKGEFLIIIPIESSPFPQDGEFIVIVSRRNETDSPDDIHPSLLPINRFVRQGNYADFILDLIEAEEENDFAPQEDLTPSTYVKPQEKKKIFPPTGSSQTTNSSSTHQQASLPFDPPIHTNPQNWIASFPGGFGLHRPSEKNIEANSKDTSEVESKELTTDEQQISLKNVNSSQKITDSRFKEISTMLPNVTTLDETYTIPFLLPEEIRGVTRKEYYAKHVPIIQQVPDATSLQLIPHTPTSQALTYAPANQLLTHIPNTQLVSQIPFANIGYQTFPYYNYHHGSPRPTVPPFRSPEEFGYFYQGQYPEHGYNLHPNTPTGPYPYTSFSPGYAFTGLPLHPNPSFYNQVTPVPIPPNNTLPDILANTTQTESSSVQQQLSDSQDKAAAQQLDTQDSAVDATKELDEDFDNDVAVRNNDTQVIKVEIKDTDSNTNTVIELMGTKLDYDTHTGDALQKAEVEQINEKGDDSVITKHTKFRTNMGRVQNEKSEYDTAIDDVAQTGEVEYDINTDEVLLKELDYDPSTDYTRERELSQYETDIDDFVVGESKSILDVESETITSVADIDDNTKETETEYITSVVENYMEHPSYTQVLDYSTEMDNSSSFSTKNLDSLLHYDTDNDHLLNTFTSVTEMIHIVSNDDQSDKPFRSDESSPQKSIHSSLAFPVNDKINSFSENLDISKEKLEIFSEVTDDTDTESNVPGDTLQNTFQEDLNISALPEVSDTVKDNTDTDTADTYSGIRQGYFAYQSSREYFIPSNSEVVAETLENVTSVVDLSSDTVTPGTVYIDARVTLVPDPDSTVTENLNEEEYLESSTLIHSTTQVEAPLTRDGELQSFISDVDTDYEGKRNPLSDNLFVTMADSLLDVDDFYDDLLDNASNTTLSGEKETTTFNSIEYDTDGGKLTTEKLSADNQDDTNSSHVMSGGLAIKNQLLLGGNDGGLLSPDLPVRRSNTSRVVSIDIGAVPANNLAILPDTTTTVSIPNSQAMPLLKLQLSLSNRNNLTSKLGNASSNIYNTSLHQLLSPDSQSNVSQHGNPNLRAQQVSSAPSSNPETPYPEGEASEINRQELLPLTKMHLSKLQNQTLVEQINTTPRMQQPSLASHLPYIELPEGAFGFRITPDENYSSDNASQYTQQMKPLEVEAPDEVSDSFEQAQLKENTRLNEKQQNIRLAIDDSPVNSLPDYYENYEDTDNSAIQDALQKMVPVENNSDEIIPVTLLSSDSSQETLLNNAVLSADYTNEKLPPKLQTNPIFSLIDMSPIDEQSTMQSTENNHNNPVPRIPGRVEPHTGLHNPAISQSHIDNIAPALLQQVESDVKDRVIGTKERLCKDDSTHTKYNLRESTILLHSSGEADTHQNNENSDLNSEVLVKFLEDHVDYTLLHSSKEDFDKPLNYEDEIPFFTDLNTSVRNELFLQGETEKSKPTYNLTGFQVLNTVHSELLSQLFNPTPTITQVTETTTTTVFIPINTSTNATPPTAQSILVQNPSLIQNSALRFNNDNRPSKIRPSPIDRPNQQQQDWVWRATGNPGTLIRSLTNEFTSNTATSGSENSNTSNLNNQFPNYADSADMERWVWATSRRGQPLSAYPPLVQQDFNKWIPNKFLLSSSVAGYVYSKMENSSLSSTITGPNRAQNDTTTTIQPYYWYSSHRKRGENLTPSPAQTDSTSFFQISRTYHSSKNV